MKSTFSVKTIKGVQVTVPNEVTTKKGYYVSYNNYDTDIYGSDTTALVKDDFYILNGDHREAYAKLDTFEECMEYFKNNLNFLS